MKNKLMLLAMPVVMLIGMAVWFHEMPTKPKTAYVRNALLFNAFNGKIKGVKKLENEENAQSAYLDSLGADLNVLKRKLSRGEPSKILVKHVQEKEWELVEKQRKTIEGQREKKIKYTEEIWLQINQYVVEYGKENSYDYIFGAVGNGSIMYAGETLDITDEVIEFINKKYEGEI